MTTTETERDDGERRRESAAVVDRPPPPIRIEAWARARGKAFPAARAGLTPAEAELLGDYNLANG